MEHTPIPFNIRVLNLSPAKLKNLREIKSLDILEGQTKQFHREGLFSTEIFGRVGDESRSQRFAFIDIRIPVFHPVVYNALVDLKRLYAGVMSGKEYAIWDPETKDFERATATTGKTGFQFFLQYWRQIEFEATKSVKREQSIALLKKYADTALTDKIVVMPAGLRDVEVEDGRMAMDDVNGFYRTLLQISNNFSDASVRTNPESVNAARYRLQVAFNSLYDYVEAMVKGKKKLLLSGWASRAVMNGTRNVITAMDTTTKVLGAPGEPDFNTTICGQYQATKSALPVTLFHLKSGFLSRVFSTADAPARLVNKKTLRSEEVQLKPQYFDRYQSDEGLEKFLTSFKTAELRHRPLEIDGRWLGLIYKGPDGTFKLLQDISEVPLDRKREDVHPVTFCELLYIETYRQLNGLPTFVTRYPITGIGSIYPSKLLIQPTVKYETRRELDDQWQPMDDAHVAYRFPIADSNFVESVSPHASRLGGLGADHDGDTVSLNTAYSDESREEVRDFFKSKRAYVNVEGKFMASIDLSTIALVFHNLTSNVEA